MSKTQVIDLMIMKQVAQYTGLHYQSCSRAANDGRLRTIQPGGPNTSRLTTREWVDEAIDAGRLRPRGDK